jgi:hypothetical protein
MTKARFDWLAELGGASALAAAAGYAVLKAAPSLGLPGPAAMTAGGFACFGLGLIAMRAVQPASRAHVLPHFHVEPIAADELLLTQAMEEPLLLQDSCEEPLLLEERVDENILLLEDRLAVPAPDSRVVQLFAAQPLPTPGELKQRIDRHLAGAPRRTPIQAPSPAPDATQALYAALNDLKRSLS